MDKNKIKGLNKKILQILRKYGVIKAGWFGSYVRGLLKDESDIDILVEIKEDISLLDFIGLKLEIEDIFERKVDLVEYCTIKPVLRDRILKEQVIVL